MSSISLYKKFSLICSAISLLLSATQLQAQDIAELRLLLRDVASEIPALSSSAKDGLLENLTFIPEKGNDFAVSVFQAEGFLYSLVIIPVPEDSDSDVVTELESITQDRALLEARTRLAFYIGQGGVDRKLFRYDDALGMALLAYYQADIRDKKLSGIESAASILHGEKLVAGLAWISNNTTQTITEHIPVNSRLNDEYCRFLYRNRALILFEAGRYEEALPVFKNIHDFKWSDIDAYLDTAECFLRTGANEDCVKLLKELIATLEEKMTSDNLKRSGSLFREAGDRESAKDSFVRARKRYHDENKKAYLKL